jgi:eukaryotic-like serine/threonine-protein kinase
MIGQVLDGKYQIARLLGEGGMGAVYEGTHMGTGRRVAIKVILTHDASATAEMVGRFQREARVAGTVETEHIVQVFDTGIDRDTGRPFTVMELLRGEDLHSLIGRLGALPPDLALRIAAQALLGLMKAHEAGIIHRDIKPANLYLARREGGNVVVKVVDFGIAKVKQDPLGSSENHSLTRTGSMLGSPLYMSPEQAQGSKQIDHRTDIWSLGAVLYQALAGRTPLEHIDTLGGLIIAICSQPPPPIQDFAPWISPEVAAIAHGALTTDLNKRFQNAEQMLTAIKAVLPQGFNITESMLVPFSDQERLRVAPRWVPPPGAAALAASQSAMAMSHNVGPTTLEADVTPKSSGKGVWIGLSLVAVLGAGGFGAFKVLSARSNAPITPEPPATVAQPTPKPEPPSDPKPAATPATPSNDRTVRVSILPAGASVDIDGVKAVVTDGSVELHGLPGSVHAIKVSLANRETNEAVVVTEGGALPNKIDLGAAPKPGGPVASPKPRVDAPAAKGTPATTGAPTAAKTAGPGLVKTFE